MSFLLEASRTALMVTAFRARASARDDAVCDDPWSAGLAGSDGHKYARRFDVAFPHMELWVACRTRFFDECVGHFVSRGVGQVVVLGAGFDTRAARLRREGVRFFEVDHPATGREKLRRLERLDGYPIDAATYVPCDFEREDFLEQLGAHGFLRDQPALLLWEGVSPYLTRSAVQQTLDRVARGCHPASVLGFDYFSSRLSEGARIRDEDKAVLDALADFGEPVRFGTNDAVPLLYEAGFRHVRTIGFDEICLTYTGTWEYERAFRFQRIALSSRTPPDAPWL